MYKYIREQESEEATELILNIRDKFNSNNTTFSSPRTPNISIEQPTMPLDPKTVPKDLKEINSFILKAGDSTNDHPNDNGPNLMLKRYYSISRVNQIYHTQGIIPIYSLSHQESEQYRRRP